MIIIIRQYPSFSDTATGTIPLPILPSSAASNNKSLRTDDNNIDYSTLGETNFDNTTTSAMDQDEFDELSYNSSNPHPPRYKKWYKLNIKDGSPVEENNMMILKYDEKNNIRDGNHVDNNNIRVGSHVVDNNTMILR